MAFSEHVARIIKTEGGLVDDPKDPGGITKYGISLRAFPHLGRQGIIDLTTSQATELYRTHFWEPLLGDQVDAISERLAMALFDFAVNSGQGTALMCLQTAVSAFVKGLNMDGAMGPKLIEALTRCPADELVHYYLAERGLFLAGRKLFPTYGRGWLRRVFAL